MNKTLAAALFALLPLCSQAADVTLEVDGLSATPVAGSMLMVGVFTDAATWLTRPTTGQSFPVDKAVDGRLTVVLKNLPAGPLALSVFQDVNANGKLDMQPGGFPAEPFGFSNGAVANCGPPRFEQAVLTPAAGTPIKIRLR